MEASQTESPAFESRVRAERYRSRPSSHLNELAVALRNIATDIMSFNETVAKIEEADRAHIRTPPALVNAWIHITLALATFPSNPARSLELARRAGSEISTGTDEIIEARSEGLRLRNLVVLPFDLLSLIARKLLRDITPGHPDLSSTYGSYLNMIVRPFFSAMHLRLAANSLQESDIVTKHSDRRIEQRLALLQQELSIIDWTVELQKGILSKMLTTRESVSKSAEAQFNEDDARQASYAWMSHRRAPQNTTMVTMAESILESNEPCGFSYLLLREGFEELGVKRNELKLMGDLVAYLTDTVCCFPVVPFSFTGPSSPLPIPPTRLFFSSHSIPNPPHTRIPTTYKPSQPNPPHQPKPIY